MKNKSKDKEIIKAIISTGIITPPSEDFNEKIMNRIISHSMILQHNKFPAFNIIKLFVVTLTLMVIAFNLTLIFNYFFDFFELNKIVMSLGKMLISLYSSPITPVIALSLMSVCVLIFFDRFLSTKFKVV